MVTSPTTGGIGGCFSTRSAQRLILIFIGAVYFWEPTNHVFRFGFDELCPIYEEFSWFQGQAKDLPLVILHLDIGPKQVLVGLLGVDVRAVRYMFVPGGLDLRRLVHFSRGFEVGSNVRVIGAMVSCFAMLLFVIGDLIVDISVIFDVR